MTLHGADCVVLGAGGAARAAGLALKSIGARVRVCARRPERGRQRWRPSSVRRPRRGRRRLAGICWSTRRPSARGRTMSHPSRARRCQWRPGLRPRVSPTRDEAAALGSRAGASRPLMVLKCWWRRRDTSLSGGRAWTHRHRSCRPPPKRSWRRTVIRMKQTSFEEFVELSRRGTFVPVCREIMADLLTPVSAFLKIAEHSDYAFLLESVEGGEHVGRYSFLGKDPFMIVRGRDGETTLEQAGVKTSRSGPVHRDATVAHGGVSVAVCGRPAEIHGRRRRFLDYDAAEWFEPAVSLKAGSRSRPVRIHDLRHDSRVRSRQASDPGDCERAPAARTKTFARCTTSRARRSISSSASSSAICHARAGRRPQSSR